MGNIDLGMLGERSRDDCSRRKPVRGLFVFCFDEVEHDLAAMEKNSGAGNVKITLFDCCLCLTTTADRYYVLEKSKESKVKFREKIKELTGVDIKQVVSNPHDPKQAAVDITDFARVCKPCANLLVKYSAFKEHSRDNLNVIAQRQSIVKRWNTSPQSPHVPLPVPDNDDHTPPTGDDSGFLDSEPECALPSTCRSSTPEPGSNKTARKRQRTKSAPALVNMPTLSTKHTQVGLTRSTPEASTASTTASTPLHTGTAAGGDHAYVNVPLPAYCQPDIASPLARDKVKVRGVQWDSKYRCSSHQLITPESKSGLLLAVLTGKVEAIVEKFSDNKPLLTALKRKLLLELDTEITGLLSRSLPSVLLQNRPVQSLDNVDKLVVDIFGEMDTRCSFLLDILITVMNPPCVQPKPALLGPLACMYSIMLSRRDMNLSAFQRMTTLLAVKGGASDKFITQLNRLGITLGTTSKLNLLKACEASFDKRIVDHLKSNSAVKITGDNLDMYVRTGNQSSTKTNRDLHMFTSNIIFSRVYHDHLSNIPPEVDHVEIERVLLSEEERAHLINAYAVLVGRLLCKSLPEFAWLSTVLPDHIPHTNDLFMSLKSDVFPLPILKSNESRYEECFDILDSYEDQVVNLFTKAHGNTDVLDEKQVIVGGDQLTRVRLHGARGLRNLAPDPILKYKHLNPVVCEMWHVKQDLLHKAYAALFNKDSHTEKGTLYYFKVELGRKNVNGKVKSNFKAHWDLLITVGSHCIVEQAMEYFGMETTNSIPTNHQPLAHLPTMDKGAKGEAAMCMLRRFVQESGYVAFNVDEPVMPPPPAARVRLELDRLREDGTPVFRRVVQRPPPVPVPPPADHLQSYAQNLCHWTLHLLELDDTAKEGDTDRLILNSKYSLPLFFSHSTRSHYFRENLDFILKATHLSSPQMQSRIVEGAFINMKGGKGKNVEADLVQEHSVRNRKDLIRGLGANKTDQAIQCVTASADHVTAVEHAFNKAMSIRTSSGRHSKAVSEADIKKIQEVYRKVKPFHSKPGRTCKGFCRIDQDPTMRINKKTFCSSLTRNIKRTIKGAAIEGDPEEPDDDIEDDIADDIAGDMQGDIEDDMEDGMQDDMQDDIQDQDDNNDDVLIM